MRTVSMAAAIALLSGVVPLHAQTASPRIITPGEVVSEYAPPVDIWLDQDRYYFGQRVRPYFATEPGAFVTIVRVSTDGELRVLYPRRPGLQSPYRLGQLSNDRVPDFNEEPFRVHESAGTGFVFAIASYERFDYRYYTTGGTWSVARLASTRLNSDPFEIVRGFIAQTLNDAAEYSIDYATYDVESSRQRSRYASRYGYYGYDDYYDLCISAFSTRFARSCSSYYGGYGVYTAYGSYGGSRAYGQPAIINRPGQSRPVQKRMRVKPLVVDPLLPTVPRDRQPVQGRLPVMDSREAAAVARRERMLREERPRVEVRAEPRRAEPEARVYREPMRRSEPRYEAPRVEQRRAEPQVRAEPQIRAEPRAPAPARVEVRNERPQAPPQAAPARIERTQKDN